MAACDADGFVRHSFKALAMHGNERRRILLRRSGQPWLRSIHAFLLIYTARIYDA
jgi:hypothetical protein